MSDDVTAHIAHLHNEIERLKGIVERTHRQGTVTDVDYSDPTKPRIRIAVGKGADGKPVKGPWVPHTQHAGDRAIHAPLTVGQQVLQISPDGNFESGLVIPYGFSKPIPSPSTSPTDHVDKIGDLTTTLNKSSHTRTVKKLARTHTADSFVIDAQDSKLTFSKDGLFLKSGGVNYQWTKDGFKQTGGKQQHDDKNVGSTHVHGGIIPGGSDTAVPEAA